MTFAQARNGDALQDIRAMRDRQSNRAPVVVRPLRLVDPEEDESSYDFTLDLVRDFPIEFANLLMGDGCRDLHVMDAVAGDLAILTIPADRRPTTLQRTLEIIHSAQILSNATIETTLGTREGNPQALQGPEALIAARILAEEGLTVATGARTGKAGTFCPVDYEIVEIGATTRVTILFDT
jgi:hypothetical protein